MDSNASYRELNMRTWTRTTVAILCGACGALIPKGSPIQTIAIAGVKRVKNRGACCADGQVPEDLPELAEPSPIVLPVSFGSTAKVAARVVPDWKQRQAGDD